jgi:glutaminyl-peptide cyclotransferase
MKETAERRPWFIITAMAILLTLLAAFWRLHPSPPRARIPASAAPSSAAVSPGAPQRLTVKILSVRPHDPGAFTQGLVLDKGALFESTGLNGRSSLREVDPRTGEVKRKVDLPEEYFAEGLALAGTRLIQLTWQNQKAFVYDRGDFKPAGERRYDGQGWGLCWDGRRLVMTDGSDRLTFRDPETFAVRGEVHVTLAGQPVQNLNELECVDGEVYANVWETDSILRIDPASGRVTAVIDAANLLTPAERGKTDVLNGIAWDPARKTFLITGKLWPKMFEVAFVPRP